MRVYVLGGGLAGLSAAYQLTKDGVETIVVEALDQVGGLAQSFTEKGYTYDLGPHRFHSSDKELNKHFVNVLNGEVEEKIRKSRILLEGRFFEYPLKVGNAIFNMPLHTMVKIIIDYLTIKVKNALSTSSDSNFEDWVVNRFGWKLYEIYFKVYTEKTWGMPCTQISADWAAQRITLLSLWDTVMKTLFKSGDTPRTYVSKFNYPKKGGIGGLSNAYVKSIKKSGGKVITSSPVKKIHLKGSKISSIDYEGGSVKIAKNDLVFSTIPLTDFVRFTTPSAPKNVLSSAKKLKFRAIVFVTLFLEKEHASDDHWIYLPQQMFTSNRLSESKNFNVKNTPHGKTCLTFEITCQVGDKVWNEKDEKLAETALDDAVKTGLVEKSQFIGASVHRMEHGYPIYDLEYKKHMADVIGYMKSIGNLRFFGRNGLYRYNNMDHSVSMGLTAAKSVSDKNMQYLKVATEQKWFG
ncbi:MAG: FAD-dependent oxidoreductase [Candidatus Altiarchaeota archaeon]|nr:FAD-dependent oxidoreductase [Candidatus Altiarchaeota archaeon]